MILPDTLFTLRDRRIKAHGHYDRYILYYLRCIYHIRDNFLHMVNFT